MPLADAFERVDALFERFQAQGHAPAVAYGIVAGDRLVHAGGYGSLDSLDAHSHDAQSTAPGADSIFRIASMSKSFTATAILMLRDAGALRLDDAVADYVPELASLAMPTADSPALTIRHLLTMSGGLPTDDPWGDRQESLDRQAFTDLLRRGFRFVAAPGTLFEYSNLGYAILGRVVQNLHEAGDWAPSGLPGHTAFHDFVRARILSPLAMTDSGYGEQTAPAERLAPGWRRSPSGWEPVPAVTPGAFSAMGGLHSTVNDLARWVAGFLDAVPPRDDAPTDSTHPLSRAARREMQQQHRAAGLGAELFWPDESSEGEAGGATLRATAMGYGFGLFVEQITGRGEIVSHSGGYPGYGSHMRWHPASGVGIVALANATYAGPVRPARVALEALLDAVDAPARRVQPAWPDTLSSAAAVNSLLMNGADEGSLIAAGEAGLFAENIELDQPAAERTQVLAEIEQRVRPTGATGGDSRSDVISDGPAHARWVDPGEHGRRSVVIRLSPELDARVQTFAVSAIVSPSAQLLRAAHAVASDRSGPIAVLGASGAPVLNENPIEAESPDSATFAISAGRMRWRLRIAVDENGALLHSSLRADA